MTYQKVVKSH